MLVASRGLSRTQRVFNRFAGPQAAAAMEAHSRAWLVQCPDCGFERSIWDLGGIRYKAAGTPRMLVRCPSCGRSGWHKVHKAADFPTTSIPASAFIRLILSTVLVSFILVAILAGIVLKLAGIV